MSPAKREFIHRFLINWHGNYASILAQNGETGRGGGGASSHSFSRSSFFLFQNMTQCCECCFNFSQLVPATSGIFLPEPFSRLLQSFSPLDCSKPSIFSYFYSIVERADRIARELDASAKPNPTPTPACFVLASFAFSFACVNKRSFEQFSPLTLTTLPNIFLMLLFLISMISISKVMYLKWTNGGLGAKKIYPPFWSIPLVARTGAHHSFPVINVRECEPMWILDCLCGSFLWLWS